MSASPSGNTVAPLYTIEDYAINESLGYLIKRVRSVLTAAIEREITGDVTYDQWGVLLMIGRGQGETAAMLSRGMDCDTGSMTRMLDRLEAKGLITRTRSTDDRRRVRIDLTPAGRQAAERLVAAMVKVLNHSLRGFRPDELEQFKGFLRRVLDNHNNNDDR